MSYFGNVYYLYTFVNVGFTILESVNIKHAYKLMHAY